MIDLNKKYWFYLYSSVYVTHRKGKMLLLNTADGISIENTSGICIDLIKEVYDSCNLGVVALTPKYLTNSDCLMFINLLLENGMGNVREIDGKQKPVNLLPILNLQRDVDRLKKHEVDLKSENLMKYLAEINFFINNQCGRRCDNCSLYYKQTNACTACTVKCTDLSAEIIDNILLQASASSTKCINMSGGNIATYLYWDKLLPILQKYDYDFHFWIQYLNLSDHPEWMEKMKGFKIELLINFPVRENSLEDILLFYKNNNITFHFLIENENQFDLADRFIERFDLKQINIIPIYTNQNLSFFEENIFLQKEDILIKTTHQKIFCNQKLNSNFFGKLYVFPDGSVKANVNTAKIGNINDEKLLQIVFNEMNLNTAWRIVRDEEPCCNCLYQYLCPPPSNYEKVMEKVNLCHVEI